MSELRRRHVFNIAVGWAAFFFAVVQIAPPLFGVWHLPSWAFAATVWTLIGATPVVLILAWVYDVTSEGIRRTSQPEIRPPDNASIAILPFTNMTDERDTEYFSDGITEDIITRASRMRNIKVISRTSVMQFKNSDKPISVIGRELDVATVLTGSVRRSGNRVRITVQLVDARTDAHKWAETYDRVLTDIFQIQTDVANRVATALKTTLSADEKAMVDSQPTESVDAYDLYLRARHAWNLRTPEGLEASVVFLKQAIALDDRFALAIAALADSYVMLGVYGMRPAHDIMPLARETAERALRIDPTLPEAFTSLAAFHALYQWDFGSARRAFDAASEIAPQYATAPQWFAMNVSVPLGLFDEAQQLLARARDLDPLSPIVVCSRAVLAYYQRDYQRTLTICDDVLAIHPAFPFARYFRGLALDELGRSRDAIETLRELPTVEAQIALARALARSGESAEARNVIAQLEASGKFVSPGMLAIPYVALNEHERALQLLEQGLQAHAVEMAWIGVRPVFDPLRGNPRFTQLLSTVGVKR